MAPIRRYLRITKFSVLEVRIYLDKPSDAPWLLSSKNDVLKRIIDEIRPKVLPKLREENENAKRKTSKKKRGIKDVASQDDFEVTIFLTETSTRHSLLAKQKRFLNKSSRIKSTSSKLTSWLRENSQNDDANPIHITDEGDAPVNLRREETDEDGDRGMDLDKIPEVAASSPARNIKRSETEMEDENGKGKDDALVIDSSDEEPLMTRRQSSRSMNKSGGGDDEEGGRHDLGDDMEEDMDDKKKLAVNTSYDGFSIYGRVLCLVVKRKGPKAVAQGIPIAGSEMMEHWVSTQANPDHDLDDDTGEGG